MKENNLEVINGKKLRCLFCKNPNLSIPEIKPIKEQKMGLDWLLSFGLKKTVYSAFYRCTNCNQISSYPILYCKNPNQTSTTEENNHTINKA
jgi:transcription elongation factor Elf1